ncbi:hypothetical protein FVEN_g3737 [Fusarium venenatum]|uniref:Aminoglycoside phosphotransferase domain-containing protein n=1 Tax=Fusarium venenatum TaxID=56646 RepID=A0A2L2T6F6_9HYPO|nr:uncharacterized protein FVRRES_13710 [Fusarium venenatum]KAG8358535.1 hypothetical protein FVEN_g3737 [Fusarium venenatum]CEI41721.1 unnamed protein product [Fusarium venenatum]
MRFVAANTSIPVPTVHCSFIHKNQAFIIMERVQGHSFVKGLSISSHAELENIFKQLRQMFQELKALPPPPGTGVHNFLGGSLRDSRIPRSRPRIGPFKSIRDFHFWLLDGLHPEEHPNHVDDDDWKRIKDMVIIQDGLRQPPVFAHGDLNPFNIMVRDGRVAGIIDWEFAGWYHYYWEYTAAWYGNETRQAWQDLLTRFLDVYPEELEIEKTRQKW